MIVGDHFAFDIQMSKIHGSNWIVLELVDTEGERIGCRWHVDAQSREIAASLNALARKLDPKI